MGHKKVALIIFLGVEGTFDKTRTDIIEASLLTIVSEVVSSLSGRTVTVAVDGCC